MDAEAITEEEALENELLREVLEEGRGERDEKGEREEWKRHVGWHRKEDIAGGLRRKRQRPQAKLDAKDTDSSEDHENEEEAPNHRSQHEIIKDLGSAHDHKSRTIQHQPHKVIHHHTQRKHRMRGNTNNNNHKPNTTSSPKQVDSNDDNYGSPAESFKGSKILAWVLVLVLVLSCAVFSRIRTKTRSILKNKYRSSKSRTL